MRRLMLLAVSVLMVLSMAVSPAFAHDWDGDGWDEEFGFWVLVPVFVTFDVDFDGIDDSSDCDFVDCGYFDNDHEAFFALDDECEWEWSDVFEEWEVEC